MGKADKRQAKLTFAGGGQQSDPPTSQPGDAEIEEENSEMSVRSMFLELKTSLAGIDAKLDHVTERLDRIRARVDDHDARFEVLESRTSEMEDAHRGDREQIAQMERLLEVIRNKNEGLEARSRRNNICIVGLLEATDMGRMEDFVESMLQELFAGELSRMLVIERAHRSLGPRPPPGTPPRPIIARLLNYRDRDAVLHLARERRPLVYKNSEINFFPDYTPGVQAQRRAFLPSKRLLSQAGVGFALLYPARLRVRHEGKVLYFSDPKQAAKFARRLPRQPGAAGSGGAGAEDAALSDND
ncbi:hypothetical protein NDU88_006371 [Pleurodeles waltl]|uniref:L1 transposable element RRM domain-containing protein n=1 Tax=Pleurodeles waltl TaxID=8319 RepID=A0AAV7N077_PLEWA|nr:hypothetical protein NDU88_006371 [Pleurodeles waltl]